MILTYNTGNPATTYYFWNRPFHYGHGGLTPVEMEIPFAVGYLGSAKASRESIIQKANARPGKLGGTVNLTNMDTYILEDLLEIKK